MVRLRPKRSWLLSIVLVLWAGVAQAANITLEWNPNPETVAGYRVYWGNQPGVHTVGSLDVGNNTTVQITGLIDGAPYYFVVRAYNSWGMLSDPSVEVSRRVGIPFIAPGDFTGDGASDVAVFRPSNGSWYVMGSVSGAGLSYQLGTSGDVPVPGDYDGDGKIDAAVFRPSDGVWYLAYSSSGTAAFQWGNGNDIPVPGDYDGDAKTDIAVFRPSDGTWYLWYSSSQTSAGYQWGNGSDIPVPGDYDGDGKTDIAVFRPSDGTWYVLRSGTWTGMSIQWGNSADIPVF